MLAPTATPEQTGTYGAAPVASIRRYFLHPKSGGESERTVLIITGLASMPEVKANTRALLEATGGQ